MFKVKICMAALIGAACLAPASAFATTTAYNFSQVGWQDQAGDKGTLTGSFSGALEGNGDLVTGDLSSFQADFAETVNGQPNTFIFNLGNLTDFSFNVSSGVLSFAAGSASSGIELCTGPDTGTVCFGIPPNSGSAVNASGFFEDLPSFGPSTTMPGASVSPGGSAAPEPQSVGLILSAGVFLLCVGGWRRRNHTEH